MDQRPDVSVIIPVGSVDDLLRQQLEAMAGQSYAGPWELVLALNRTDPASRRALEDLVAAAGPPMARIVDAGGRVGPAHARNQGAAAARSDRLAFCDGDDLADPGWLEAMVRALGRWAAVGGHLDEALLAVPGQQHWRPPATPGDLPRFLGHRYLVSANLGIRRSAFVEVGGFDEDLVRGEDMALSFRLLDAGHELGYAAGAVVHYRHRAGLGAMLRQHYLYGRGMSQIIRRGLLPAGRGGTAALRPNRTPVDRWSVAHVLRKAAIAAGRLTGLATTRAPRRRAEAGAGGR